MRTGRRLVKSRSNGRLIGIAKEFLSCHTECVVVAPSHSAGEEMAHRVGRAAGIHRLTLVQLAADLARSPMSGLGLAPLSSLGLEALAARVAHMARAENE